MTIVEQVARKSGTFAKDWVLIDGPDSGTGVDYWLENRRTNLQAYVNDDQGFVSIEIMDLDEEP